MKDKLMLLFSFLFLLFVVLIFVNAVKIETAPELETHVQKSSVTFILGDDKDTKNHFYQNAESYFKLNPETQTDEVVTSVRSLNGMIRKLNQNSTPFSNIHMVVHSNPWSGMSLPLEKEDVRLNAELLANALQNGSITQINSELIDSSTVIHLHACGIGYNRELITQLSKALNNAQIIASEAYVNFKDVNGLYQRSEFEPYYAFYPTAYKPADLHLARQLSKRYPDIDKDWMTAMENMSYKYNIPIEWEITYPEYEAPALNTEMDKLEWLMNQDELLDIIEKTDIPFDYFRWIIKRKDDRIQVFGKVTVLCVLEEIQV